MVSVKTISLICSQNMFLLMPSWTLQYRMIHKGFTSDTCMIPCGAYTGYPIVVNANKSRM